MSKNIVVFSDGTGQDGGTDHNTNVYKLFNFILDRSPRQISFYDKGVGTGLGKATGNIVGRGFSKNVRQCYQFIFQNFEEGDKIFLFGFSRGAATVRSLTGFIHLFGVLPRSRGKLITKAWNIYKIKDRNTRTDQAEAFVDVNHNMWVHVEFLGVWDTVAALGVPSTRIDKFLDWIVPHGFHDFSLSGCVKHAYHALAIDDVRKTFHPVLFHPDPDPDTPQYQKLLKDHPHIKEDPRLRQVWFMGMHTDVGGGYGGGKHKELSDITLEWMVQHAVRRGLHLFKHTEGKRAHTCTPKPNGFMHNSRNKGFRKLYRVQQRRWDAKAFGQPVIHESVKLRTADINNKDPGKGYKPWILEHNPATEDWTHLDDWKRDKAFTDVVNSKTLEALEAWSG